MPGLSLYFSAFSSNLSGNLQPPTLSASGTPPRGNELLPVGTEVSGDEDSHSKFQPAPPWTENKPKSHTMRFHTIILFSAVACMSAGAEAALSEKVTVTLSATYWYTGFAPSPTPNFSLSFEMDRSPLVVGGSPGAFLAGGVSAGHYMDGPLDTFLGLSEPPSVLFRDAGAGGGFSFFQNDLPLNRLSFIIGSSQLFEGTLANPTLLEGVYEISPNPPFDGIFNPFENPVQYASYAGQSFASGDPVNNPFQDPETLQSYDPLMSGSITISGVPEPTGVLTGLLCLGLAGMRRRRR